MNKPSLQSILDPDINNSYKYDSNFCLDSDIEVGSGNTFQPWRGEEQKMLLDYLASRNQVQPKGGESILSYTPVCHSTPYSEQITGSTLGGADPRGKRSVSFVDTPGRDDEDGDADDSAIDINDNFNYTVLNKRDSEYRNAINSTPISSARTARTRPKLGESDEETATPESNVKKSTQPSMASQSTTIDKQHDGDISMVDGFLAFIRSHPHGEELFKQYEDQWRMNPDHTHLQTALPVDISVLEEKVENERDKSEPLQGESESVKRQSEPLQGETESAEPPSEPHREQSQEVYQLKVELQNMHQHNVLLKIQNIQIQTENRRLESDKVQLESDKAQVQTENKRLESDKVQLESENTILQTEKTELENENALLQTEKTELESENALLQTEKTELESENALLQTEKTELESERAALQSENSNLQTAHSHLQTTHSHLQTAHSHLQNEKSHLQTAHSHLQTELNSPSSPSPSSSSSSPITPDKLPQKHLYNRLEMNHVDSMSLIQAQNIIKNISLIFDIPSSQLPKWLPIIAKLLSEEDIYLNFTLQVHKILYNGQELNKKKNRQCLNEMVKTIEKLKKPNNLF